MRDSPCIQMAAGTVNTGSVSSPPHAWVRTHVLTVIAEKEQESTAAGRQP